jgi:hypothetical protein
MAGFSNQHLRKTLFDNVFELLVGTRTASFCHSFSDDGRLLFTI